MRMANDIAGVRVSDVAVPLAAYSGSGRWRACSTPFAVKTRRPSSRGRIVCKAA
jgi:hypothetical protein